MVIPSVGDHLLITYNFWHEPHLWWVTEVEWTDGKQLLVQERTSQQFTPGGRTLISRDSIGFVGTRFDCEAVHRAALISRAKHVEPIRAATIALDEAREDAAADVIAILKGGAAP